MIIDAAELKRRHSLRVAGVRDKKAYIGPEVVDLIINNSCNLGCRFCWAHAPESPARFAKAHFFSWEKFLGVVRDSVDLQVDQITIVGSGEPTIHPKFRDMMRRLEQQPLKVKLFTNAAFPADYCSDVIRGDEVVINLSAVDRQQYLDLKGKDFFGHVVDNIKRFVSLRNASKPRFRIEIAYIVNAANIHQMQTMREMASQLGVDSVHFKRMNVHAYNKEIALPEGAIEGEGKRTPPLCLNGWFNMGINSEGNTSTCCRVYKMPMGDFDKLSLKGLWSSPHMMNMRLLGKYGHIQKMYKACQTCPYYERNIQRAQALAELEAKEQAVTT